MAETVGSILGNHVGKGRFLDEANLSKEMVLGGLPFKKNLSTPFTTIFRV